MANKKTPGVNDNGGRIPTQPQGGERIPTMPQGGERIPTMPQGGRIPTMPQGGRIPTMPQGGRVPTQPQQSGRVPTVPQEQAQAAASAKMRLREDITFAGETGTFIIEAKTIVSDTSGESTIYGAHRADASGADAKERYVARILTTVTPDSPHDKRAARDRVIAFLKKARTNKNSCLLPLTDCGTITVNGKDYYVEIYPFCAEGDALSGGRLSYKKLKEEVIPNINEALHQMHEAGFVHRDVKPDNIYHYKGRYVIADFGITCDLRDDGFATDRYKTGTLGYYAPELMSQAAIIPSDYYSLGQTLWTLYSGEMMYQNILRRYKEYGLEEQRDQINFAMLKNEYYGLDEIRQDDSFFEVLIRGLLQYDITRRFGYDEVKRWLEGDRSLEQIFSTTRGTAGNYADPFVYNKKEYWNNEEVYGVLTKNWEGARELVFSDELRQFYVSRDYGLSTELQVIEKKYSTSTDQTASDEEIDIINDNGLARFFMTLNNDVELPWRGAIYHSFSEIADALRQPVQSDHLDDDLAALLSTDLPDYWYRRQTEDTDLFDVNMVQAIQQVRNLAGSRESENRKISCAAAFFLFTGNPEEIRYQDCDNLLQITKNLTHAKHFCAGMLQTAHAALFHGFLIALGFGEAEQYLRNGYSDTFSSDIECLMDVLTSNTEDSSAVSELCTRYRSEGPRGHLYWWQQHLDLYKSSGHDANKLMKEIKGVKVPADDLTALRAAQDRLETLSVQFRSMFTDNVFLAAMGFSGGKDDITSDKAEAYWHYNFLDQEVPFGFAKDAGLEVR